MKKLIQIIFVLSFVMPAVLKSQPTWMKYYQYGNKSSKGFSAIQTNDGGYVIAGNADVPGIRQNILLIKVNSDGEVEWRKLLGDSTINIFEYAHKIQQLKDSSFFIVGESQNKMLLMKTDPHGNISWKKLFTQQGGEARGFSFRTTREGGIILCGDIFLSSPASIYPYIVKTDFDGNLVWQKIYTDLLDVGADDILEFENKYYFCASHNLRKIDSSGNTIWTRSFLNNFVFVTFRSLASQDENTMYAGGTSDSSGYEKLHLVKFDSLGNSYWQKRFFIPNAEGESICIANNGNIAMIGEYISGNGDIAFAKISPLGELLNFNILKTPGDYEDASTSIKLSADNGFTITGWTSYAGTEVYTNVLGIKTDSTGYSRDLVNINENNIDVTDFNLFQNYPNPFNPSTTINYQLSKNSNVVLNIYDITGRKIMNLINEFKTLGNYEVEFKADNLPSGIYFYSIEFLNYSNMLFSKTIQVRKMIFLK